MNKSKCIKTYGRIACSIEELPFYDSSLNWHVEGKKESSLTEEMRVVDKQKFLSWYEALIGDMALPPGANEFIREACYECKEKNAQSANGLLTLLFPEGCDAPSCDGVYFSSGVAEELKSYCREDSNVSWGKEDLLSLLKQLGEGEVCYLGGCERDLLSLFSKVIRINLGRSFWYAVVLLDETLCFFSFRTILPYSEELFYKCVKEVELQSNAFTPVENWKLCLPLSDVKILLQCSSRELRNKIESGELYAPGYEYLLPNVEPKIQVFDLIRYIDRYYRDDEKRMKLLLLDDYIERLHQDIVIQVDDSENFFSIQSVLSQPKVFLEDYLAKKRELEVLEGLKNAQKASSAIEKAIPKLWSLAMDCANSPSKILEMSDEDFLREVFGDTYDRDGASTVKKYLMRFLKNIVVEKVGRLKKRSEDAEKTRSVRDVSLLFYFPFEF